MKASRDKTLISGERTTREPSTMHERTNEGVWWVGYVCRKKNLKTTMTRGNNGKKGIIDTVANVKARVTT